MAECEGKTDTALERLQKLLKKKPETYDVTFCVGPEKKLVRGLKDILKAASPVLKRDLESKSNMKTGHIIVPLPEFDGKAFELFITLTTLDTWSLTSLNDLNLPPNELLNLITICRHFEMVEGLKNLTEIAVSLFRLFPEFEKSTAFLQLSRENLQTLLASEEIPIREFEIFQAACRWAVNYCQANKLETSETNIRLVLGGCLHEIRFPLMTNREFTEAMEFYKILTAEESVKIYRFIGLDKTKRLSFEKSDFRFKTEPRMNPKPFLRDCKKLNLTNEFKIVNDPPFECNGKEEFHCFCPSKKITVHGLGFLGPIEENAFYSVTFRIWDIVQGAYLYEMYTRLWAEKGKVFHWMFPNPIILEARELNWKSHYNFGFSLKGPPTSSVERQRGKVSYLQEEETEFLIQWHCNQLAEILFKTF